MIDTRFKWTLPSMTHRQSLETHSHKGQKGRMKHEHTDLGEDAWVDYYSDYYSNEESSGIFERLRDELDWEHRDIVVFGKPVKQPRLIAWAAALNIATQVKPCRLVPPRLSFKTFKNAWKKPSVTDSITFYSITTEMGATTWECTQTTSESSVLTH